METYNSVILMDFLHVRMDLGDLYFNQWTWFLQANECLRWKTVIFLEYGFFQCALMKLLKA